MESSHGVNISWLHHSHKDYHSTKGTSESTKAAPKESRINSSKEASNGDSMSKGGGSTGNEDDSRRDMDLESAQSLEGIHASQDHRVHLPHLRHRHGTDGQETTWPPQPGKTGKEKPAPPLGRRGSWITSLSSKFSSSQQSPSSPSTPQGKSFLNSGKEESSPSDVSASPTPKENKKSDFSPQAQSSPKPSGPSFLQSALRRLSSSGGAGLGKGGGSGSVCPRKVMNIDPYRERCQIDDLEPAKLRRVSFCVDVEIAAAAAASYAEEEEDRQPQEPPSPGRRPSLTELERMANYKKNKEQKQKMKDKAEAVALKHPAAVAETKDATYDINCTEEKVPEPSNPDPEKNNSGEGNTRKKEKKKRSEEERKARKEKKRLAAVANGTIPMEITRDSSSSSSTHDSSPSCRQQDKPTTDPLRIYRRCCQLRETSVLKRITDQLSSPTASEPSSDGTVTCLDLSGSRLPLPDIVTLGDYLAVVPVRKVILEDCDLSDEAVRVILAGLLSVKTVDQARFNRDLSRKAGESPKERIERLGVIEKISLKNNPRLGRDGWRHICLFIHMSQSLKAIDISMIPFPEAQRAPSTPIAHAKSPASNRAPPDTAAIIEKCLIERTAGPHLEELVMAECRLGTEQVLKIVHGVKACGTKRLGLANNSLTEESIEVISDFVKTGRCEGLDVGGNDLSSTLGILTEAISAESDKNSLYALSLADCNLSPKGLKLLLPALTRLPNFRFIDLSHNRNLFSTQPNATGLFRKYFPQMALLKRIHLNDVAMESEHCIALAEVLPEVPNLAHISLVENPALTALASAKDEMSQEEACALYASLMAAVRVSRSIVSVEIDLPSQDAGEIIQALAKQVVAYSLRNIERGPVAEAFASTNGDSQETEKAVEVPDILLHLVGHMEGNPENHDADEPAPDSDYIVGGTGVVKALSVCLGNKVSDYRRLSGTGTPSESGTTTPIQRLPGPQISKSKAMSKNLLGSARKIRARLQPALAREAKEADDMAYRRLQFLDSTLERIIQRFEDEYPECRIAKEVPAPKKESAVEKITEPNGASYSSVFRDPFARSDEDTALDIQEDAEDDDEGAVKPSMSRHDSDVSLASKHLAHEEGRIHRLGQQVRRDMLRPQLENGSPAPSTDVSSDHLQKLRTKLEAMSGQEIIDKLNTYGEEEFFSRFGARAGESLRLQSEDAAGFEKFKEAQLHAQKNMGDAMNGSHSGHGHGETLP